jgi:hypothetical protein
MSTTEPPDTTDRGLVLAFRSDARLESRTNPRTGRFECRIVCLPEPGMRRDLSAWCGVADRAWQAACLKLGLRLHRPI